MARLWEQWPEVGAAGRGYARGGARVTAAGPVEARSGRSARLSGDGLRAWAARSDPGFVQAVLVRAGVGAVETVDQPFGFCVPLSLGFAEVVPTSECLNGFMLASHLPAFGFGSCLGK